MAPFTQDTPRHTRQVCQIFKNKYKAGLGPLGQNKLLTKVLACTAKLCKFKNQCVHLVDGVIKSQYVEIIYQVFATAIRLITADGQLSILDETVGRLPQWPAEKIQTVLMPFLETKMGKYCVSCWWELDNKFTDSSISGKMIMNCVKVLWLVQKIMQLLMF